LKFPIADSVSGTDVPYYALADANKNITYYFDSNGNVVAHYEYSPFGKITQSSGTMADDFDYRFSSEVFDTETNLVYYNYRYYSPELGRWLSRDPITELGHGLIADVESFDYARENENPYRHTDNDPLNNIDRLGRFACGGACIAAIVGAATLAWCALQVYMSDPVRICGVGNVCSYHTVILGIEVSWKGKKFKIGLPCGYTDVKCKCKP
jgi:RHS repeat-associated protein